MGRLSVYSYDPGVSEFGETSSSANHAGHLYLSLNVGSGPAAPLEVREVQPRQRSFFNGNSQTNLTQCHSSRFVVRAMGCFETGNCRPRDLEADGEVWGGIILGHQDSGLKYG